MTFGLVQLPMTIERRADATTVRFGGSGGTTPDVLERQLAQLVAARPARVLLDLADLAQVSGVLLGVLLSLRRGVVTYGGEIRITGAQPIVLELFRRTGLNIVFDTQGFAAAKEVVRRGGALRPRGTAVTPRSDTGSISTGGTAPCR